MTDFLVDFESISGSLRLAIAMLAQKRLSKIRTMT